LGYLDITVLSTALPMAATYTHIEHLSRILGHFNVLYLKIRPSTILHCIYKICKLIIG
jgi:hypothetical protein